MGERPDLVSEDVEASWRPSRHVESDEERRNRDLPGLIDINPQAGADRGVKEHDDAQHSRRSDSPRNGLRSPVKYLGPDMLPRKAQQDIPVEHLSAGLCCEFIGRTTEHHGDGADRSRRLGCSRIDIGRQVRNPARSRSP